MSDPRNEAQPNDDREALAGILGHALGRLPAQSTDDLDEGGVLADAILAAGFRRHPERNELAESNAAVVEAVMADARALVNAWTRDRIRAALAVEKAVGDE